MYRCEGRGVAYGFLGGGSRPGEGHEVDGYIRVTPGINLERRIPGGAVAGGIVCEFRARQEFVPRGCIFLDETAQKVAQQSVCDLCLPISLRVEGGGEPERRPH